MTAPQVPTPDGDAHVPSEAHLFDGSTFVPCERELVGEEPLIIVLGEHPLATVSYTHLTLPTN